MAKLTHFDWLTATLFFFFIFFQRKQKLTQCKICQFSAIHSQNSRFWLATKQEGLVRTNQIICFGGVKLLTSRCFGGVNTWREYVL